MLILMEPPEKDLHRDEARQPWRREYVALAAVAFAIAVSLLGLAIVILEAAADEPPTQERRLVLA